MSARGWGLRLFCLGTMTAALSAQSMELRLGAMRLDTRQNVVAPGVLSNHGSVNGLEFLARGVGGGVYGRYLSGRLEGPGGAGQGGRIKSFDVRLLLGPQIFTVEGGYVRRDRTGPTAGSVDNLIRAGIRSSLSLGPSGFSVLLTAGGYGRFDSVPGLGGARQASKKFEVVGWEASAAMIVQAPRQIPLYLTLGYRFERIRTETGFPPIRKEELGSLMIGLGLRYLEWKRPKPSDSTT